MRKRFLILGLTGVLAVAGAFGMACGDDDDGSDPASGQTVNDGGGGDPASSSSIVRDTFLTFEGKQYRLVDLLQADLLGDDASFEEAGEATEADVDAIDLTVYRRAGDDEAIYTFLSGEPDPVTEADEAADVDFWYRWVPES